MQNCKRILLFSLIFMTQYLCAQPTAHGETVTAINFEGLKKNDEVYLLSLIESRQGEPLDTIKVKNDVQRLINTSGIGHAAYEVAEDSRGVSLSFQLQEIQTLLPIVKFGGIKENIWYQLGFVDINWKGRGQTLSAYYQNNDQRHSGQIYYRIPRINNSAWGFSGSATKWSSREPLYFPEATVNYYYDNNSVALSGIRNFGLNKHLELGGTYFVETYSKTEESLNKETPGPLSLRQPKYLGKIEYQVNKLDYHFFYLKGHSWKLNSQNVFNSLDKTWFHSVAFQGKQFFHLGRNINLAFRLRMAISSNNDTPFAPFVADSHVNIRGVGNRIDRGTAQLVLNAEYRHTLFHSNNWAAQAVVFLDSGTWRNPGGELKDIFNPDQFREFVGGGIRVINNKIYGAVLRIDYGIDIFNKNQKGFVIGLGQYF